MIALVDRGDSLRDYYERIREQDLRRRDLLDDMLNDMRERLMTGAVGADLTRSYELLVAERALVDGLVQITDRHLALLR
jgi:hypothetical protein